MYSLDYTTGAAREVIAYLQEEVKENATLRMLPHCPQTLALKDIYIPVKVSRRRILDFRLQKEREINNRYGDYDQPRKAYEHRGEEAYQQLAERSEEVILQWDIAWRNYQRVVILGDPGQGKTTVLKWTLWKTATESLEKLQKQVTGLSGIGIPVYVRLAMAAAEIAERRSRGGFDLAAYVLERVSAEHPSERFLNWFKGALDRGQVIFLFDALDEVHEDSKKTLIHEKLADLLKLYPHCRYVLTSRVAGYTNSPVESGQNVLELVKLGHREVENFVHGWFGGDDTKRVGFLTALRSNPSLTNLGRNPLLLSLMCSVYQLNGQLATRMNELYEQCLRNFMVEWRNARGHAVSEAYTMLKRRVLEEAAFTLFAAGKKCFSHDELCDALDRVLRELTKENLAYEPLARRLYADKEEESLIYELTEEDGILVRGGMGNACVSFMFLHLTFEEFLVAASLAVKVNTCGWECELEVNGKVTKVIHLIEKISWDPDWENVFVHFAGLLSVPEPLLKCLSNQRTDDFFHHRLCLAGQCLPELVKLPSNSDLADEITQRLFDSWWNKWHEFEIHDDSFQRCLGRLVDMSRSIVELLSRRLFIPSERSKAIEAFGRLPTLAVRFPEVTSRLTNILLHLPHHRGNAAEALRRIGEMAGYSPTLASALLNGLRDSAPLMRETSARIIGAIANNPACISLTDDLMQLATDNVDTVRFSCAFALGQLALVLPNRRDILATLISCVQNDNDPTVRRQAVESLCGIQNCDFVPEIASALTEALRDPDFEVRCYAADSLGRVAKYCTIDDCHMVSALLDCLERDPNENVRSHSAVALGELANITSRRVEVITALVRILNTKGLSEAKYGALIAIGRIGENVDSVPEVLPTLLSSLNDDRDQFLQELTVETLGLINPMQGSEELLTSLITILQSDHPGRAAAATSLGLIRASAKKRTLVISLLLLMLDDHDEYVRVSALNAIGRLLQNAPSRDVAPDLVRLLDDPDQRTRSVAASVLEKAGLRIFVDENGTRITRTVKDLSEI